MTKKTALAAPHPALSPSTGRGCSQALESLSPTGEAYGAHPQREGATPLIELAGVTKTYRNGDLAVEVLHGIDVAIYPGEFVAIVGQSGSGKSTLMNILGCLDRPTSGTYRFMGEDVSAFGRDELARLRREAFGFVFQSYNLIGGATATQNVEVPAIYAGMSASERRERAESLLATLGLGDRLEHRPNQLSGGQQQRVSIARALMNGGQIILADEPTGALDSKSGVEVLALLNELSRKGHTVIVITHSPEVAAHAHRVIEIRDGVVVADAASTKAHTAVVAKTGSGKAHTADTGEPARAEALGNAADPHSDSHPDSGLGLRGFAEACKAAVRALRANVFRTALTLLGIVIGVGSVIAMLAVGDGAKQAVVDRISGMGTNLILIRPGAPNRAGMGGNIATMTPEDAEAIAALPNVLAAVPELGGSVTARYENIDYQTQITSTAADFPIARNWPVARGIFFSRGDVRGYAPVAVLGQTVARNLFPDGAEPIGKHIVLKNVLFQVVGVAAERGASPMGTDQDDVVFVPYTTGGLRLFGQRFLRNITVAVDDVSRIDETQQAVSQLLEARHRTVDFQIRNMASLIETATETQNTLTILLGSIAAISLLVGGIGVMNIMLVNVTERTREIGVRMATGARMRDILQQFLTEAVAVSALGGLIGVAAGLGAAALIAALGTPVQVPGTVPWRSRSAARSQLASFSVTCRRGKPPGSIRSSHLLPNRGESMKTSLCVKTISLAVVLALAGCGTTSPMLAPNVSAPAAWNEAVPQNGAAVSTTWWNTFGSQELQSLVSEALAGSPDLAIAMERVRQAEAQVRVAGASLFPSLDLGVGTSTRTTRDSGRSLSTEASSTVLSVSYELDLWGRNRSGVRAAESSLQATVFDRDTARLTLISGVAAGYFEVLTLRSRLSIARENLAIAERVLELVSARSRNGVASALDVSRQQATVLSQRAAILPLEQQERQTLAALAVLTGRTPEGFVVNATSFADLQVPAVDPGLPAQLLVRRPDLASAEARLAAANADVAAARAALLPSIALTGSAGTASNALLAILGGPTTTASLALSVLAPIFDGGRLRGQVAIAQSQERELVETYRKTILTAFEDVENALGAAGRFAEQETLQAQVQTQAREALRLAEIRYREGVDDLLGVLDAQRTLFNAQDQLAQIRLNRLDAAVNLYKALGGGWTGNTGA